MHEEERRHEEGDERERGQRVGRYGQMGEGHSWCALLDCDEGDQGANHARPSRAA